jgi:mannan endo-1,4-beta-mannosidase
MIVLSENGSLFDPELAKRDGAMWGYWCVWNGDFVRTEQWTTFDKLREFYNSEFVLNHEDLPDLKSYPIYIG